MAPVLKTSAASGDIYKSLITNVATVRNFEAMSEKAEEEQSLYFGGHGDNDDDNDTGIATCDIYPIASNKDDN